MYFPLFVDLSEKRILMVGAGKIAARRIQTMLDFVGSITVIAPDAAQEVALLSEEKKILWVKRDYQPGDLDDYDMVFAATNSREVNMEVYEEAVSGKIPVNISHDQSLCDFFFPAVIHKDPMVIGITASGKDHAGVRQLRQEIEQLLEQKKI